MAGPDDVSALSARMRAKALVARGRHFFTLGKFDASLRAYQEAAAQDPSYTSVYIGEANALVMLGRFAEAIALCDDILTREPDQGPVYTTRANALHRRGDAGAARPWYEKGCALAGDDYMPFYDFACYWALEGNEAECEKNLAEALRKKPALNSKAAVDPDFSAVREREWFRNLVAFKGRIGRE